MLLALELLLVGELAAGFDGAVLRAQMLGVRTGRLGGTGCAAAARRARDLKAGGEAFQIAFLLGGEIARHGAHPAVGDTRTAADPASGAVRARS